MFQHLLRSPAAVALALALLVGTAGCDSAEPALADVSSAPSAVAGGGENSVATVGEIQGSTYYEPGCIYRYTIDPGGQTGTWSVGTGSSVVATGTYSSGILWADVIFANVNRTAVQWNYSNVKTKLVYRGDPSPPC